MFEPGVLKQGKLKHGQDSGSQGSPAGLFGGWITENVFNVKTIIMLLHSVFPLMFLFINIIMFFFVQDVGTFKDL